MPFPGKGGGRKAQPVRAATNSRHPACPLRRPDSTGSLCLFVAPQGASRCTLRDANCFRVASAFGPLPLDRGPGPLTQPIPSRLHLLTYIDLAMCRGLTVAALTVGRLRPRCFDFSTFRLLDSCFPTRCIEMHPTQRTSAYRDGSRSRSPRSRRPWYTTDSRTPGPTPLPRRG